MVGWYFCCCCRQHSIDWDNIYSEEIIPFKKKQFNPYLRWTSNTIIIIIIGIRIRIRSVMIVVVIAAIVQVTTATLPFKTTGHDLRIGTWIIVRSTKIWVESFGSR